MRPSIISSSLCLVLLVASSPARAADDSTLAAAKATVTTVREVGSALYYWVLDHTNRNVEADGEAPAKPRWSACPPLAYEEAQRLLVPQYIAELPRTDGWGNDLELCLARERLQVGAHLVVGVRSAGRDGQFEGDEYSTGAFDPADYDRDVVWLDGYFVTWPQKR